MTGRREGTRTDRRQPRRPALVRRPGRTRAGLRRLRDDRGQAAVEFTGTIPLILVTFALLWQAALTGYTFALAGNAADEAVRAGTVGGDGACRAAGDAHLPSAWRGPTFKCGGDGDLYRASVRLPVPLLFPGVSFDVTVDGDAAAPWEEAPP
ncbi:TadE/TadG family type IV pilus assembly protein [Streptomyces albipurpureus]|uniref:Pilus assembly protein n=1 Tax=Streptomyces albipurpureus TaxID=2897419 RepID=A0ABT0ULS5_9ACTN|nr:TadE family protein [Streptomyces sp. CWNU-1]MCM2389181.1 pilus assembly protein [Streptomyces sp. CWNU-1]